MPAPIEIPPAFYKTAQFKAWLKTGDIRILQFTDASGCRYDLEMMGREKTADGKLRPLIRQATRYRHDRTLDVITDFDMNGRPSEWTIYTPDGKTKSVRVVNRLSGIEGAPFVQYVNFLRPDGTKERQYQANRYGVVYLEWLYNEKEELLRWNGSSKYDHPLATLN